ncbi:MAG: hypothetical protein QXZ70_00395 [Candidatus Bathyarchaeia archaeon]
MKKRNSIDKKLLLELLTVEGDVKTLYKICEIKHHMTEKEVNEYIAKELIQKGLVTQAANLPTEEGLRELGWTLTFFFIKLDLTTAFRTMGHSLIWVDMGNRLKALTTYMNNEFEDFKIMSIATAIGSRYDLIVLAYTKGIGLGFSEFASKITNLLPTTEVVTHPFVILRKFDPLPFGQSSVWNEMAGSFDEYVTRSKIEALNRYMFNEKFYLDNVIAECTEKDVSLIEIGSGTGRLLTRYLQPQTIADEYSRTNRDCKISEVISDKVKFLVGVEVAEKMIEENIRNLEKNGLVKHLDKRIFLFNARAEYLDYFISPDLETEKCIALKKGGFWKTKRIACAMLNTLGIMRPGVRQLSIKKMKEIAGADGVIVLSVFDGSKFLEGVEKIYSPLEDFVGDFIPEINIDYERHIFTTMRGYYSHWFEENEIKGMLERNNLQITDFKKDPESFSMYATAVPT